MKTRVFPLVAFLLVVFALVVGCDAVPASALPTTIPPPMSLNSIQITQPGTYVFQKALNQQVRVVVYDLSSEAIDLFVFDNLPGIDFDGSVHCSMKEPCSYPYQKVYPYGDTQGFQMWISWKRGDASATLLAPWGWTAKDQPNITANKVELSCSPSSVELTVGGEKVFLQRCGAEDGNFWTAQAITLVLPPGEKSVIFEGHFNQKKFLVTKPEGLSITKLEGGKFRLNFSGWMIIP